MVDRVQRLKDLIQQTQANDNRLSMLERAVADVGSTGAKPKTAPPAQKRNTCILQYSNFGDNAHASIMAMLALNPLPKNVIKPLAKRDIQVPVVMDVKTKCTISGEDSALKYLGRLTGMTPPDEFSMIQTESWVTRAFSQFRDNGPLTDLNQYLKLRTMLVGRRLSTGDLALWSVLRSNATFLKSRAKFTHVNRYFGYLDRKFSSLLAKEEPKKQEQKGGKKNKGKGKQKGGKKGKSQGDQEAGYKLDPAPAGPVVTRFPPEPSGYMHLGHCKALLFNYGTANEYNGKLLVRFDDTNPEKERVEFEHEIKKDIDRLGINYAQVSHTSDQFQFMLEMCTEAIKSGLFYVDCQAQEEIKEERMNKKRSPFRDASVEENLENWVKMQEGEEGMIVRAKLEPESDNGTLRDPTMYRTINSSHHMTKDKYKVYPNYDYACPLVDTIEGVSHAMRSKEYNERDVQYSMLWDLVLKGKKYKGQEMKKPLIKQFSRLDFQRTELSKRKLQLLVDEGVVSGWDDPRMPTVRGALRRGLTMECIHNFMATQAGSDRDNCQEWDKIFAMNKEVISPKAKRFWAITTNSVTINVTNAPEEGIKMVPSNPTNRKGMPNRPMQIGSRVLVDQIDAQGIKKVGQVCNLISWGNIKITNINRQGKKIVSCDAEFLEPPNPVPKGWYRVDCKLSWVADCGDCIPVTRIELDFLLNCSQTPKTVIDDKTKIERDLDWSTDWKKCVVEKSWFESAMIGEKGMRNLRKGDIIEVQRVGFFIVEQPYLNPSCPMKIIDIPTGQLKAASALAESLKMVDPFRKVD